MNIKRINTDYIVAVVLSVILAILKVTHIIAWSWVVVLLPILIALFFKILYLILAKRRE